MLFVLAQNILEAEGPWLESFVFVSWLENLLVLHSLLEIADLNNFLLSIWFANWFYLDMAECSHGLHLWNGYWYHKTFIHCKIQWHKAYYIFWIPWRPMQTGIFPPDVGMNSLSLSLSSYKLTSYHSSRYLYAIHGCHHPLQKYIEFNTSNVWNEIKLIPNLIEYKCLVCMCLWTIPPVVCFS